MAKGENIFKRKDGRWEARYIKGREVSGKIKYGYCYGKTYKEAKEKVEKVKAEIANGKYISRANARQHFCVFCEEWLESNKYRIKESTYVKYLHVLEQHIKPRLGMYYPLDMDEFLLKKFSNDLLEAEGLSPKTVKDILVILRSILKFTQKSLGIALPPWEIQYPKECKKEMRVLSREEQTRFIRYLLDDMDPCKFGILLTLFTGMRIGEVCALKWENISPEEGTLCIAVTMQRLRAVNADTQTKTHIVIDTPKSNHSRRVIPMTADITKLCLQKKPDNKEAYVLTGTTSYMEPRTLQYRLERYAKDCGLEGVHFHSLRHTFATRCVEAGFEVKSLSEILGHSTTTITLDRYVHSSMELKRENMNKLASIEV